MTENTKKQAADFYNHTWSRAVGGSSKLIHLLAVGNGTAEEAALIRLYSAEVGR